jgi:hypothetical protein
MGYLTDLAIRVDNLPGAPHPMDLNDVMEMIQQEHPHLYPYLADSPDSHVQYQAPTPFIYLSSIKLYSEVVDALAALSRRVPGAVFWLFGVGENALFGDLWSRRLHNGVYSEKTYHTHDVLKLADGTGPEAT